MGKMTYSILDDALYVKSAVIDPTLGTEMSMSLDHTLAVETNIVEDPTYHWKMTLNPHGVLTVRELKEGVTIQPDDIPELYYWLRATEFTTEVAGWEPVVGPSKYIWTGTAPAVYTPAVLNDGHVTWSGSYLSGSSDNLGQNWTVTAKVFTTSYLPLLFYNQSLVAGDFQHPTGSVVDLSLSLLGSETQPAVNERWYMIFIAMNGPSTELTGSEPLRGTGSLDANTTYLDGVFTFVGSGSMLYFYEGVEPRGSASFFWTGSANASELRPDSIFISSNGDGNLGRFFGNFYELCIWDKAFTQDEVTTMYNGYWQPKYGL